MAISQKISTTGSRGGRPTVEGTLALCVADLRSRWGWLRRLDLDGADGFTVKLSLDICEGDAFAWVHVEHWPAGARWAASTYDVDLIGRPAPFGGLRWWLRCPDLGVLATALFLPADGSRLASRQAHGLGFMSQRQRAPARDAAHADRLRQHLGGSEPFRPKGMHAATFARRVALLARLLELSRERAAAQGKA